MDKNDAQNFLKTIHYFQPENKKTHLVENFGSFSLQAAIQPTYSRCSKFPRVGVL